jgi:hypothetical protein
MKRISFSIFVVVAFVLLYYAQPAIALQQEKGVAGLANLPPSNEKEWSEEESEETSEHFLRNSPTFVSRGIEDSLKLLNTTLLEQPFAWQFDYEFECWCPGYGRLSGEPTPQVATPHQAEIIVQEGKVVYAVLDDEWDILVAMSAGHAYSPPPDLPEGNHVELGFGENMDCLVSGDTFTNAEITGLRVWRITSIRNTDDETGAPVKNLKITLDSDMTFDGISPHEYMTTKGPPTYEWSFGDLVEESQHTEYYVDAVVMVSDYPSTITPGLDASRSFDKTVFTTPETQTLNITVTPREEGLEKLAVCVVADENDLIDPIITSYSSTTDTESIKLTADSHRLALDHIPVKLNTPLIITVILEVTPKVPLVNYKPQIAIIPERQIEADVTITSGSYVSYTVPEMGTWTVSAEGDYVWNWLKGRDIGRIGSQVTFTKMVVSGERGEQMAEPAPTASATTNQQVIIGIAAAILIIGSVIYIFIRRWRGRASTH